MRFCKVTHLWLKIRGRSFHPISDLTKIVSGESFENSKNLYVIPSLRKWGQNSKWKVFRKRSTKKVKWASRYNTDTHLGHTWGTYWSTPGAHLGHTSGTKHISGTLGAKSPGAHLRHTSGTLGANPGAHLGHTWGTSEAHLGQTSSTPGAWAMLRHTWGTLRANLGYT